MNILIASIVITSTIIFAFTSIYGKILISKITNSWHFFILQTLLSIPILIIINFILKPDIGPLFEPEKIIILLIASLFAFVGFVTLYKGFETGNVSVGGVLLSARVLVSIPLALLLGEIYPLLVYFFIFIALIGAFLVSYNEKLSKNDFFKLKSSGMNYFLVTLVFWAISNSIVRNLNNSVHPLLFLLFRSTIFIIICLILYPILNKKLANNKAISFSSNTLKHAIVYVCILIIAQLLFLQALGESLTIAEGLGVLEGVFTFLMAILLSKIQYFRNYLLEPLERKTLKVRTIGVIITTLATIGVVYILQTIN